MDALEVQAILFHVYETGNSAGLPNDERGRWHLASELKLHRASLLTAMLSTNPRLDQDNPAKDYARNSAACFSRQAATMRSRIWSASSLVSVLSCERSVSRMSRLFLPRPSCFSSR